MQNWLESKSIQFKLSSMFIASIIGFIIYFLATISTSSLMQAQMSDLVSIHLPVFEKSDKLARSIGVVRSQLVQGALSQTVDGLGGLQDANKAVIETFASLDSIHPSERAKFEDIRQNYQATYNSAYTLLEEVVAGLEKLATAQGKFQQYSEAFSQIETKLSEIKSGHEDQFKLTVEEVKASSYTSIVFGLLLVVGAIPFTLLFFQVLRTVNRKLTAASIHLQQTSGKIYELSNEAQTSSGRLAATSSQQAASVLEIVASMEQMSAMLARTTKHSNEALSASDASFEEANRGMSVVKTLRDAMATIEQAYVDLGEVTQLVREISNKTSVINDIVFKTQILSFNASIEAARAGQHGRGFAVVAEEVGNLADTSGAAAVEIEKLLEYSIRKVSETIDRTKQKIEAGNTLTKECSEAFERITLKTSQTKEMVSFINQASTEQEAGVQSVSRAMNDLSEAAGETDEMARLTERQAKLLNSESNALADTVSHLNQLVQGQDLNVEDSDDEASFDSMTNGHQWPAA